MGLFGSEENITNWQQDEAHPKGIMVDLDSARTWIELFLGDRTSADYAMHPLNTWQELWTSIGCSGDFWDLGLVPAEAAREGRRM